MRNIILLGSTTKNATELENYMEHETKKAKVFRVLGLQRNGESDGHGNFVSMT